MSKDIKLRTSFNNEALLYHKIRPRYPEPLFETLVQVTKLQKDADLLEIGPGTGQATEALAKLGYKITAIELGTDLAEVAKVVLKKFKNVEVITGSFEEVELPLESFDLVYAATAFHWINPKVRFTKPYNLLRYAGYLAIIHTNHVSDEAGDNFFFASQSIYNKYKKSDKNDDFRLPHAANLKINELDENLFKPVFFGAFPLVVRYTADEYIQLLSLLKRRTEGMLEGEEGKQSQRLEQKMASYRPEIEQAMKKYYATLAEKDRRRYAAVEAMKLGTEGVKYIAQLLGCSEKTVRRGIEELENMAEEPPEEPGQRQPGGGRKGYAKHHPDIDGNF